MWVTRQSTNATIENPTRCYYKLHPSDTRGLSKKYPTLKFPAHSSDARAVPLCTMEEDSLMCIPEWFLRVRVLQAMHSGRGVRCCYRGLRVRRTFYFSHDEWKNWAKIFLLINEFKLSRRWLSTVTPCAMNRFKIHQVFGDDVMEVTQIEQWFNRLKNWPHIWREAKSRTSCVLWHLWNCASRVCTGRTKGDKRVQSASSPPTPWYSSAQKTRPLDGEKLTVALWQCSSTFISPNQDFLGEAWNSSRSPTSLLSRHGTLRLLVVSEIEKDSERIPYREQRRYNAERDGGDEHRSVYGSRRIGGLSVWRRKESTLKGIRVQVPSRK